MKKNLIKVITLSAVFAIGVGFSLNSQNYIVPLEATQHEENYDAYTYSGNYYSSIAGGLSEGLHGDLRKALSSLILPKAWYTYSGSSNGTLGQILQSADEDPTNLSNMVLLYTRDSIKKSASTVNNVLIWNREHTWPQALSNGNWKGDSGKVKAGADLLHIRPTYEATNSARGDTRFGDNGKKGVQKYQGMDYAYTSGAYFEPIDAVKGDIARILMYVWTAYYDYYNDSGLMITKAIESYDTLLKWHTLDKPDALEGHRNDFSESSNQKNRNPFVDHPEYAWKIFGDNASADVKASCKAAYPSDEPTPPSPDTSEPPISSSSEAPISSEVAPQPSEPISEPPASSSSAPVQPDEERKGCGSLIATTSLVSLTSLIGLIFILSKRK